MPLLWDYCSRQEEKVSPPPSPRWWQVETSQLGYLYAYIDIDTRFAYGAYIGAAKIALGKEIDQLFLSISEGLKKQAFLKVSPKHI